MEGYWRRSCPCGGTRASRASANRFSSLTSVSDCYGVDGALRSLWKAFGVSFRGVLLVTLVTQTPRRSEGRT